MEDKYTTQVLDHGHVHLVEGSTSMDHSVINAARVSYGKRIDPMLPIPEGDEKLIAYLMRNHHGTPFEHNFLSFRIKAPIFVMREWHRHRVGISINEMSARYMELPAEWYVPDPTNVRRRVGKPGNYVYELVEDYTAERFCSSLEEQCFRSYNCYKNCLEEGIAPEQARLFLHVNHYSEMIWSCNARSLMHFLGLRNAPDAQWEIRQYAQVLEAIFNELAPLTCGAFVEGGRVAP